jgi:hypothetical protein
LQQRRAAPAVGGELLLGKDTKGSLVDKRASGVSVCLDGCGKFAEMIFFFELNFVYNPISLSWFHSYFSVGFCSF